MSSAESPPPPLPTSASKDRRGSTHLSPPSEDDSSRRRTLFSGAFSDVKKRIPYYISDFTDALEYRCVVSVPFMFFACAAPSITFGGLMGKYTNERMGMTETLMAQALCGIIWALFSCQPLMIQSATGPVLIFEASLARFCDMLDIDLLTVRFFAGIFIFLLCLIVVAFEGAWLLKYVTRFTEDIFSVMISGIFIYESLHFLSATYHENPVENYEFYEHEHHDCNQTERIIMFPVSSRPCHYGEPNTTLLTFMILFFTFIMALILRAVGRSIFFGKRLRNALGDFSVFLAIAAVATLSDFMFPDPFIARLEMPEKLNFTNPAKRGHGLLVIPRAGNSLITFIVAFAAAVLVFVLIFVETEITELLLSRKKRGLVKGTGMNWDLILAGVCSLLCSFLGLPWMCAAAVQSVAHCNSLTVSRRDKLNPQAFVVERVIEQRLTTICVALLIGAFALLGSILRLPMASLFGVFLFLGVMNMAGVELLRRVALLFIPVKYHWKARYTKNVGMWKMHLYTAIQVFFVAIITMVKQDSVTALGFPLVLILFVIFRQFIIPEVFSEEELQALDGEDDSENEEQDNDCYAEARVPI